LSPKHLELSHKLTAAEELLRQALCLNAVPKALAGKMQRALAQLASLKAAMEARGLVASAL
jgi:hypothetical protein